MGCLILNDYHAADEENEAQRCSIKMCPGKGLKQAPSVSTLLLSALGSLS